jgi:hypothetical protein
MEPKVLWKPIEPLLEESPDLLRPLFSAKVRRERHQRISILWRQRGRPVEQLNRPRVIVAVLVIVCCGEMGTRGVGISPEHPFDPQICSVAAMLGVPKQACHGHITRNVVRRTLDDRSIRCNGGINMIQPPLAGSEFSVQSDVVRKGGKEDMQVVHRFLAAPQPEFLLEDFPADVLTVGEEAERPLKGQECLHMLPWSLGDSCEENRLTGLQPEIIGSDSLVAIEMPECPPEIALLLGPISLRQQHTSVAANLEAVEQDDPKDRRPQ